MRKRVCIFCGANTGNSKLIVQQIEELVELLISSDFDLVYGGSKSGLMGIIADKFLSQGKEVIGIMPQRLIAGEYKHPSLTNFITVKDMHERKAKMIEASDVFIAVPGGVGTLDEIIEVYTQVKIGFINKFCGILNTDHYYNGLTQLLEKMVDYSFLRQEDKQLLYFADQPQELSQQILDWETEKNKEIDKVAYIHLQDGKILTSKSKGKSKYYIPGGKRESRESDEETLQREVLEELSVQVIPSTINYVGTFKAQADGKKEGITVKMTCYSAQFTGELLANNEIEEIKWLSFKDLDLVAEVDKIIFTFLKDKGQLN